MTLRGQFRTSVRSIQAVGVSPKALSGGGPGGAGAPPRSIEASYMAKQSPNISKSRFLESGFAHPTIYAPHQSTIVNEEPGGDPPWGIMGASSWGNTMGHQRRNDASEYLLPFFCSFVRRSFVRFFKKLGKF